jgi:glycosyltransferase involved in cell wall biosynthesis
LQHQTNRMTTILMVRCVRGPDGGLENHFLRIAKGLLETGNVRLVFVLSSAQGEMYKTASAKGIPCHLIDVHNYLHIIPNLFKFLSICREYKVDVVQSHMLPESMFGRFVRLLRPGIRHVFRVHTHIENVPISRNRKRLYHFIDRLTSSLVDCYAPLNRWLVDELVQKCHVKPDKIHVVTNGTNSAGSPDVLPEGDAKLNPSLAVVGRLHYDKGQHLVMEAVASLKKQGLEIGVELFGAGETPGNLSREPETSYYRDLVTMVGDEGIESQVKFHGQVTDVPSRIRDIPVLVLPSYHEGISNAILEALSMRKIVVATAVGGSPDIIENGINGFLVPKGDAAALAEVLHMVYSSSAITLNDLREAGFLTWRNRFSTPEMIKELLDLYLELGIPLSKS